MYAAKYSENPVVLSELLAAGADVNAKDAKNMSVLDYAKEGLNPLMIESIVKAGAK